VRASATRAWRGPRLVNIFSIPGSGKSALVIHVGQALSAEYPDCQIYFNLRSSDQQPVSVDSLLGNKLVELGLPMAEMPSGLELRSAAYRSRLAAKRSIIVVDNAASAAQVEPLLPGFAVAAVIVTSWALIPQLAGAHARGSRSERRHQAEAYPHPGHPALPV
jgi:hypothetical protein